MKRSQHVPFTDEIVRFQDEVRRIAAAAARAIFAKEFERNLAALRAPRIPGLDGPAANSRPSRRRTPRAPERTARRSSSKRARAAKPAQQLTLPLAIEPGPAPG